MKTCLGHCILCNYNVFILLFFQLLGCGVLSLGLWLQVNRGPQISILPSYTFLSASALCITAGAIILLIGFLGCCGAFYENQCMLIGVSYVTLLLCTVIYLYHGSLGDCGSSEFLCLPVCVSVALLGLNSWFQGVQFR